jgi:tRNA A-37 threonylcarbamoyl transferase component Bud32
MTNLKQIVEQFDIAANVTDIAPLGNGLINDTYLVSTEGNADDYVLQRVNAAVFPNVEGMQQNIKYVTEHISAKLKAKGVNDISRRVLRFIELKNSDKTFLFDGKDYWRISVFIKGTKTLEAVNPDTARSAGKAFGEFEAMLVDLKAPIIDIIPDFHNMEFRLQQLHEAVAADPKGRVAEVRELLDKFESRAEEMTLAERLGREGKLPKRICHCDTKVNNMLVDAETDEVLCVIDLDTTMYSYVFSDYGDFLRTGACTTAEDEPDASKVGFNVENYKAFTEGYLSTAGEFLTEIERDNLPYAVRLFPFMQGVRFLADYINGDTYFKIKYPEHTRVRAKAQWAMLTAVDNYFKNN